MSVKENRVIATIGHVDHGKTTLTAAITHFSSKIFPNIKYISYENVDKTKEEKERGITINITCVNFESQKRLFSLMDCPGHADFVKTAITGMSQAETVILLISAQDGLMPQTEEHLRSAKYIGVKRIIVFINKLDTLSPDELEMLTLVEDEIQSLLDKFGYTKDQYRIVMGSALKSIEGGNIINAEGNEEPATKCMESLFEIFDSEDFFPPLEDVNDRPFCMPIDGRESITGRGLVVTGTIKQGLLKPGDVCHIVGLLKDKKYIETTVTSIESHRKAIEVGYPRQSVGALLRGVSKDQVARGMFLCKPGSFRACSEVELLMYVLEESEGGRKKPFTTGYCPQFFSETASCTGKITIQKHISAREGGDASASVGEAGSILANGGDTLLVHVKLEKPMVLSEGVTMVIREGRNTIGSGKIEKILD